MSNKTIVISLFEEAEKADVAYRTIVELGYTEDEINIILSDKQLDDMKSDTRFSKISSKAMMPVGKKMAIGISPSGDQHTLDSPSSIFPGGISRILSEWGFTGDTLKLVEERINEGSILLAAHPRKTDDISAIEEAWSVYTDQLFTNNVVSGITGLQTHQSAKPI